MEALAAKPGYSVSLLAGDSLWSDLPHGATVVDVGGSHGHASRAIQKLHPDLRFIVQDRPSVIEEAVELRANNKIPADFEFMAYDFFTEQTVQADVYLFRWILHDWPDSYVVKILQNLRPALRTGSKVVINETVMPKLGEVPLSVERHLRNYDLIMMSWFNAKEREEEEWRQIFHSADARFQDIQIRTPLGATLSIIEATWDGCEAQNGSQNDVIG